MDIAAVSTLLGSLKTATDIVKFIRESDASLERAELRLKLAQLIEALATAKLEAAEVQQAILDRNETIRELHAAAKLRGELNWQQPCYWLVNAQGVKEPYCQNCYDSGEKLSRLHSDGRDHFECRVCRQSFETNERKAIDKAAADAAIRDYNAGGWMAR